MEYQVRQVVGDVKVVLDRNNASEPLIGSEDALSLEEIIESRILPSVVYLSLRADLSLFDNCAAIPGSPVITDGVGVITLPSDFLRLHDYELSSWKGRVVVIDDHNPLYAQQKSRFSGVRGNAQAPVVAVVNKGGTYSLELYSCQSGDTGSGSYIKFPSIDNGSINISDRLYEAVVYYTAYLTCVSMGDTETASRFLEFAKASAGMEAQQ